MPLRPLHDRLFVKRKEPELKTAGGIVIPDSAGEKPEQGVVVAIGPGRVRLGVPAVRGPRIGGWMVAAPPALVWPAPSARLRSALAE
jgi:hypothetical protein